jgi:hypothetical protein
VHRLVPFAVALATLSCQGDKVDLAPDASTDAASLDSSAVDTSGDSVDTSGDSVDASSDGGCVVDSKNVVPNGNFESDLAGWATTNTKTQILADGPCGKALRMYETKEYADVRRRILRAIPKGTRLRVGAWSRGNGVASGSDAPGIIARLIHLGDGGAELTSLDLVITFPLESKWTYTETTATVLDDETMVDVFISSSRLDGISDDFLVTGVSLTIVE